MRKRAMAWEVFERRFKPVMRGDSCLYEITDDDLKHVVQVANSEPYRVWTMVTGDDGNSWILVPGYHYVNRLGYVITETPWTDAEDKTGLWVKYG